MRPLLTAALLAVPFLALTGCDENDAVSVRIRLSGDMSGTFAASGIFAPAAAGNVEAGAAGIQFEGRVEVQASTGKFTNLSSVAVGDIRFTAGEGDGGFRFLRIIVPQGAEARWPAIFVPLSEPERVRAAGAFDPSGKTKDLGANLKIEIELPATVVGNGLSGKARGTKSSTDGAIATLLVPIAVAKAASDDLVWHLTWQQ